MAASLRNRHAGRGSGPDERRPWMSAISHPAARDLNGTMPSCRASMNTLTAWVHRRRCAAGTPCLPPPLQQHPCKSHSIQRYTGFIRPCTLSKKGDLRGTMWHCCCQLSRQLSWRIAGVLHTPRRRIHMEHLTKYIVVVQSYGMRRLRGPGGGRRRMDHSRHPLATDARSIHTWSHHAYHYSHNINQGPPSCALRWTTGWPFGRRCREKGKRAIAAAGFA